MKINLLTLFLLIVQQHVFGTIWQVGPTRTYTLPSQVSALVQNGDTVEIDSGIYLSDVAHWTADNLVLRGVNGMAHLKSGGLTFGDKAIWVIGGNNTRVEYIEFSEATSTSNNGAGIRQEGSNLTVSHCFFHDNEDGILAGTVNPSIIIIEYSEFGHNGFGDGLTHNLYINNIDTLIFHHNYSHHAIVGHELKSRARVNLILYNRISDEDSSTASRSIDLPNGGVAYLIGNIIQQGPLSQNSNMIGYGLEGLSNPGPHEVYAINNTLVNDLPNGSFFDFQPGTSLFKAFNNIIAGDGAFISYQPNTLITSSNLSNADVTFFNFVDAPNYNYHLTDSSTAINAGIFSGSANGVLLDPGSEYLHPASSVLRCTLGIIDIGAYEYCFPVNAEEVLIREVTVYPNPANDKLIIQMKEKDNSVYDVRIINSEGQVVKQTFNEQLPMTLSVRDYSPGIYMIILSDGLKSIINRIMISR